MKTKIIGFIVCAVTLHLVTGMLDVSTDNITANIALQAVNGDDADYIAKRAANSTKNYLTLAQPIGMITLFLLFFWKELKNIIKNNK